MKAVLGLLFGAVLLLAIFSASLLHTRPDSRENFAELQLGMAPAQVSAIMGAPRTSVQPISGESSHAMVWTYDAGTVSFANDKVNQLGPKLK